ncbi:hypothetical protein Pcinc_012195 [Petrolisthes cinctipes]|uniref:NACHT domain-containing protein n=1 Tax=Petrolisthes cinctipes TaxID=88211 RepID=A0AAE1G192_PETCI|nr:hypothetical protein Pcinc_012195 [Petrolisthes cinctipes]
MNPPTTTTTTIPSPPTTTTTTTTMNPPTTTTTTIPSPPTTTTTTTPSPPTTTTPSPPTTTTTTPSPPTTTTTTTPSPPTTTTTTTPIPPTTTTPSPPTTITTTTPSPPTTTTTTPSPPTTTTTTPSPPTTTTTTTPSPPTTTTTTTPSPPTTTTTTPSPPTTTTTTIPSPPTTTTITTPSPPTSTTTITTTTTPSPPTTTTTPSQSTSTTTTTTATTSTTTPSLPTTTTTTSSTTTTTTTTKNGKVKYGLKIIHMHYCVSRVVLYKVLQLGTPHKDPGVDVITYLKSLPSDYPVNYVNANANERKFDLSQKAMIKVNTSGDEFDITLLVQCIKLACEGVVALDNPSWWTNGNELENCVYMIKQQRNGAMHGSLSITKAEFEGREKNLCKLLIDTVNALHHRYHHSMKTTERNELIKEIKDNLASIRDGNMLYDLQCECQEELKTSLKMMLHFNPVSFILGSSLALDVTLVFTDIEIKHGTHRRACIVSYQDFLIEIHKVPGRRVVLLEGVAGSGKTTLITLMLQEWCGGQGTIKELDTYQVLLHVVCRDPSTNSYESLVQKSLPTTFTQFGINTKPLLAQCRILVLIDGLDEATKASCDLVNDVLHQLHGVDATIICTSRPERSPYFENLVGSSIPITHTSIMGIPENKRVEFVEKNHRILQQQTHSGRDTNQLIQLMQEKVKLEHFRIPLNLLLSAWVWDQDPDALGITTTQTELYYHTHRLSKMKLQQRLSNHQATCDMSQAIISDLIDEWEEVLCKELLVALSLNQLVLTPEAVRRLRNEAMNRGLPDEEMLGSFLTSKCIKLGLQQYSAPHKGLQDYYAALHIVESLRKYHQVYTTSSIRKVLNDTLASSITDLKMYQNVLQHLAGLLHLHIDRVPNHMVVEVVELLRDAGVRNREQWLDLVEDTKASPAVLTAIASNALPFQGLWSSISSIFSHPSINVKDGRVIALSALLPYLTPTEVRVSIDGRPPNLTPLVDSLARHTYTLELWDLWYHPNPTYTPNASIQTLLSSSGMVTFKGQWIRGMESISPSLRYLSLSLSDGTHVTQLVPLLHSLPRLKYLEIHVPPSVSLADLSTTTPLPEVPTRLQMSLIESTWSLLGFTRLPGAHLYQTDLRPGGERRACQVVASLQPPNAYGWLYFPDSSLGPLEWELVLKTLGEFGVKARGIRAPGPSTTHDNNLDTIARTQLAGGCFERCDFSRWW